MNEGRTKIPMSNIGNFYYIQHTRLKPGAALQTPSSLIQYVTPFVPLLYSSSKPKRFEMVSPVKKVDYVAQFQGILNLKGYQNCIFDLKVRLIQLKWWFFAYCLLVELYRKELAPAACTACFFYECTFEYLNIMKYCLMQK